MEGSNSMGAILHTAGISKKMIICFVAVLFVFFSATASFASWSQGFSENGVYGTTTYNITKIEVFKLSGNRNFESPGAGAFSAGSWTVQMPNTDYVLATNAATNTSNFNWLLYFTGNTNRL